MIHPLLESIDHRPYPALDRIWALEQSWLDLLFIHWPLKPEILRPHVPSHFDIDTFEGDAWIGVVPFGMENVRFRDAPAIPFASKFLELNVRTYVRLGGKSGVYFFSLDAANVFAVEVARLWYCLPYYHADMSIRTENGVINYRSERRDRRGRLAVFDASYRPIAEPLFSKPGSIESWLTERYCLLTTARNGTPMIGEIHHKQWPLQSAESEIRENSMVSALGIALPDTAPLLHYSREIHTIEWTIQRCLL